jgi:hypothetical protein
MKKLAAPLGLVAIAIAIAKLPNKRESLSRICRTMAEH